ncbi:hypothetical protein GCM10010499_25090 [Streptomyces thermoviolaceus subsp. apingens]|nr:hypothetical protein GCM10010499_25090 [Streptomyces thermoviolaceus subsp. apingens]
MGRVGGSPGRARTRNGEWADRSRDAEEFAGRRAGGDTLGARKRSDARKQVCGAGPAR